MGYLLLLLIYVFFKIHIWSKKTIKNEEYAPLTDEELHLLDEIELSLSKPFNFAKTVVLYSILYLFAIASPIVGALLYKSGMHMLFSVLLFGFVEVLLNTPSFDIDSKLDYAWILNKDEKPKQLKQIKVLACFAIVVNVILLGLNSYPFIVSYEGGILVTLLTLILYVININSVVVNVKAIKNLDTLFEQNIAKFHKQNSLNRKSLEKTPDEVVRCDVHTCDDIDKINIYLDRCNNEQLSQVVIKANIRISNAIIDSYKRGYLALSYKVVELQLEEKISLAKRDFVKRECRLAIEIINLLKINDIDKVVNVLTKTY